MKSKKSAPNLYWMRLFHFSILLAGRRRPGANVVSRVEWGRSHVITYVHVTTVLQYQVTSAEHPDQDVKINSVTLGLVLRDGTTQNGRKRYELNFKYFYTPLVLTVKFFSLCASLNLSFSLIMCKNCVRC